MTTHDFPYDRAAFMLRFLNGLAQLDNGEPAWRVAKANRLSLATFRQRLKRGWSGERAATEPAREDCPLPNSHDEFEAVAIANGISRRAYRARIRHGLSPFLASLS